MRKSSNNSKFIKRAAAALLALAALFYAIDFSIRPTVRSVATYQAKMTGARILNAAVLDELNNFEKKFSGLLTVNSDSSGKITSIQTNSLAVGIFKEKVMARLVSEFSHPESVSSGIPIGTLLGSHIFSGYGPEVPMKLIIAGAPTAEIESEFKSAGINQSLHRLVLRFSVEVEAVLPFLSTASVAAGDVVLAETVIVGSVPELYVN